MASPDRAFRDRTACVLGGAVMVILTLQPTPARAQLTAAARSAPTPAWNRGILPISPESYYNAIACGTQGGADPPCVFWDTGLCKNADFAIAFYTPYKMVAYEVWRVVQQKQPPPQPSYPEAQRTRVTIGITPVRGSDNPITDVVLRRGGKTVAPVDRSVNGGGARYTYDYPALAATASVTLNMVGKTRTVSCQISQPVLAAFR